MTEFKGVVKFLAAVFLPMVPAAGALVVYVKGMERFYPLPLPPASFEEVIIACVIQMLAGMLVIFIWVVGMEKLADRLFGGI